jgi:hypothetical protein
VKTHVAFLVDFISHKWITTGNAGVTTMSTHLNTHTPGRNRVANNYPALWYNIAHNMQKRLLNSNNTVIARMPPPDSQMMRPMNYLQLNLY